MSGLTPKAIANIDQARAELADLVRLARAHRDAGMCGVPVEVGCPGAVVVMLAIRSAQPETLLFLAVGELARTGYGRMDETAAGVGRKPPADGEAPTSASPAGAPDPVSSGVRPPVTPDDVCRTCGVAIRWGSGRWLHDELVYPYHDAQPEGVW